MNKKTLISSLLILAAFASCSDDNNDTSAEIDLGDGTQKEYPDEYYAGGRLGTTTNVTAFAYEQPTPAVEQAGMTQEFFLGEKLFERDFNQNTEGAFTGLGPLAVRVGCLYCHPSYGHGKRQTEYRANTMGNGYLLVLYENVDGKSSYLTSLTGMPQTLAVAPFKAPIDETKIKIDWKDYTDEWGNQFPDGETYGLIYPEVSIPADAYYVPLQANVNGQPTNLTVDQVGIRLESTIGIYGTGLIDAIPGDSIIAQWRAESPYCTLNPAYYNQETNEWTGWYSGLSGEKYVRRYTYAMSRGPVMDAAGANAIWNITNVTRSDRRYHYMTAAYATTASQDPEVQKEFYNYFPEYKSDKGVEYDIYHYLMGRDEDNKPNAKVEMTDDNYKAFMVWHRGLAVPAARNTDTQDFKAGKKLFSQIGCAVCHRPSWQTGEDDVVDPNKTATSTTYGDNSNMPRYPHQTIWPYTDMVQHRLFMQNDIRTGWCRTTPLWGRGLSKLCTGAEDRLHDCRARNTLEAIMWHGNTQSDARRSVENFRKLSKAERDQVIYFIESI